MRLSDQPDDDRAGMMDIVYRPAHHELHRHGGEQQTDRSSEKTSLAWWPMTLIMAAAFRRSIQVKISDNTPANRVVKES